MCSCNFPMILVKIFTSARQVLLRNQKTGIGRTLCNCGCFYETWWRHQMETFPAFLALCAVNSPYKSQWRGALMFSLMCAWFSLLGKQSRGGDLRRHCAHNDVIVMKLKPCIYTIIWPQSTYITIPFPKFLLVTSRGRHGVSNQPTVCLMPYSG